MSELTEFLAECQLEMAEKVAARILDLLEGEKIELRLFLLGLAMATESRGGRVEVVKLLEACSRYS